MWWIIILVVVGLVLYFAELALLPGVTIAGIVAFGALVGATVGAFGQGAAVGWWVVGVELVGLGILTALFFRPRTWRRVALHTEIKDSVGVSAADRFKVGDRGEALTRLAPMGNVLIAGQTVEAKTRGGYVDEGRVVEVIGFENGALIVKEGA